MAMNRAIVVEEASQVGEARREAVRLAQSLALDAAASDRRALAVPEAATNLVKHARRGMVLLSPLVDGDARGVEVIALDHGPGMADVAASMRDGHSTAGSPGLGLGSIARLAGNVDVDSQPGAGTTLRFALWKHEHEPARADVTAGGVCVAKPGEQVCGDGWTVTEHRAARRLLVVDGLGHGPDAAIAANTAIRVAREQPALSPEALLSALHDALRSTRGAAAAVASVFPAEGRGVYAGVGNIRGFVCERGATRHLVSHNGTLGQQVRRIQPFDFEFGQRALLVMHSDGITSHWNLDAYPGIARHHPSAIAATVFRDHARGRDDATVAVLRNDLRLAA
jgi:anti-sigma regulatory factor (Ser/Thr protein kinase)